MDLPDWPYFRNGGREHEGRGGSEARGRTPRPTDLPGVAGQCHGYRTAFFRASALSVRSHVKNL
jgi:hypothetical protein